MTTFALDASAVVAWLVQEEPRWHVVASLLEAPHSDPVLPAPALTEVLAVARKRGNISPPSHIVTALAAAGVRQELLVELDMLRAAEIVGVNRRTGSRGTQAVSLGDALILSVVERLGVPVVTCDQLWRQLADEGVTSARVISL